MADTPNVRNTVAKQVLTELKEAGIASDPLVTEAGLQMYQLNRDMGWIPYDSHALLLEAAAREMADPYYGLNLARRVDPRDYGALAYVGLSSATLEDALLNFERYVSVQTEAWTLDLDMQSRLVASRHSNLLSSVPPAVQKTILGASGTFYRLGMGPFQSKQAATELCNKLTAAGERDCLVRRR